MKKLALISAAILTLAISNKVLADGPSEAHSVTISIPEVALLDLEGVTSITLAPTAPTEAGDALNFSTAVNNSIWVNYSSVVASGNHRTVTAKISSGTVPTGLSIKVLAGAYSGSGKGTLGTAGSQVTLNTTTDQPIVSGIGSCYTGNGTSNGHQLSYSLILNSTDDYDELLQASTTVDVTYTITDDI